MITVTTRSGQKRTIKDGGGTILQALEREHVQHRAHCKGGNCGVCRMKLKSGFVQYVSAPLGFLRDGEILPCVCVPDGDVEVEC